MKRVSFFGVAICAIACGGTPRAVGVGRLSPASVFTATSFGSRDAFGNASWWTDIYDHRSATDSEYVGTLGNAAVDSGARIRLDGHSWAISSDGRSIVFRHAQYLARGHPKLESGFYQYVYGVGLKPVTPPFRYDAAGSAEFYAGTRRGPPVPTSVLVASGVDTVWALAATGEMFPLILLESSALHRAAFAGRTDECEALIRAGANIDSVTRWNHTALDLAIIGGHAATVDRLLDLRANPSAGMTALPLAVSLSRTSIVDAMLRRGTNVNATDEQGNTLLHLAVNTVMRDGRIRRIRVSRSGGV